MDSCLWTVLLCYNMEEGKMNYYMAVELKTKVHKLTVQSPPTISTLFSNYSNQSDFDVCRV